jgi:hypothetical protein
MIRLLFLIIVAASLAAACQKSQDKNGIMIPGTLTRSWIFTEQYYGNGGPGIQWQPANPANQVLEFKADGTLSTTIDIFAGVHNYTIIDSVTVKLTPASASTGISLLSYQIDTIKGSMTLTPTLPLCFEGCAFRFKAK